MHTVMELCCKIENNTLMSYLIRYKCLQNFHCYSFYEKGIVLRKPVIHPLGWKSSKRMFGVWAAMFVG